MLGREAGVEFERAGPVDAIEIAAAKGKISQVLIPRLSIDE